MKYLSELLDKRSLLNIYQIKKKRPTPKQQHNSNKKYQNKTMILKPTKTHLYYIPLLREHVSNTSFPNNFQLINFVLSGKQDILALSPFSLNLCQQKLLFPINIDVN